MNTAAQPGDPSISKPIAAGYLAGDSDGHKLGGFLEHCHHCRKRIAKDADVFMYGYGVIYFFLFGFDQFVCVLWLLIEFDSGNSIVFFPKNLDFIQLIRRLVFFYSKFSAFVIFLVIVDLCLFWFWFWTVLVLCVLFVKLFVKLVKFSAFDYEMCILVS